ncbi:MAG: DegT/DnrJ/EryC1/StrS family aminotransferase [Nitrospirota bacterium]
MQKHIPVASPLFIGNEKKYVIDCIETGWVSSIGKYIKEFEERFALFCKVKHAISCSNGTVALHLALLAYDVGPGDEIIVPTLTYVATANVVTYCGACPVFVDSDPETLNIDPRRIEEKITSKTKGIIIVHLYGHPADMDPVLEIARTHNLFVIEDAAEAHGALYKNRIAGSIGDIGAFSFFGNKIITTGEGGMVVTNDDIIAEKIRLLKGQGMDPKRRYWFPIVGYNYRLTNVQAAIGLAQLENISWHLNKRREVADLYYKYLQGLHDFLELPVEKGWARHSFWMFSILLKNSVKISRDEFMRLLQTDGIETRPIFYPMHVLPPYKRSENKYPVADSIASRGLNLPTHALLTEENIVYIADKIKYYCKIYSA